MKSLIYYKQYKYNVCCTVYCVCLQITTSRMVWDIFSTYTFQHKLTLDFINVLKKNHFPDDLELFQKQCYFFSFILSWVFFK